MGVSSLVVAIEAERSSSGCRGSPFIVGIQHAAADQRFHMLDVFAADVVGDGTDADRARHRVPAEKQMVAGPDQAGVEQHRIDVAEFAGLDAFGEQAAMEVQERRDKKFRNLVGGFRTAFMQEIVISRFI